MITMDEQIGSTNGLANSDNQSSSFTNSNEDSLMNETQTQHHSLSDEHETEQLVSEERLDRLSPDLWPEQMPGVTEFLASISPPPHEHKQVPEWLRDLDQDDINMLHGFGSLTASALLEKVKELQNLAYQLGLEEEREMTRGKFLNVLDKKKCKR